MCEVDNAQSSINNRVKIVRETLELNQREFAALLAASRGYIGGIETGIRRVNGRFIKLIVSEFNVNEEWLKTGAGEMWTENTDEKFIKLLSIFKELPPKYQEVVFKLIEMLRDADKRA